MSHNHGNNDGNIKFGIILNSLYTVVEFCFGIFTGSLALIADATHNLTDTFTLSVSYFANKLAKRDANSRKTYGYGRVTILAALLNSSVMLAVAIFIAYEAVQRLNNPQSIEGGIVALVATAGIIVNGSIAFVLYKSRKDLNMRSAFIDMAFDALSSLGAVVAGLIILLTGIQWVDTIVGFIIAALLVYNTIKILYEAVHILLEGTPSDVDIDAITLAIVSNDKVISADDMHIWAIRSGYNALSCHIVVDKINIKDSCNIISTIKNSLRKDFNINHATIEVELENCQVHK
ncbi:cation-efflux pump [Candidatus Saccharibacteria bacterium HGW-Saccharibacteria-1]|jgi:cobalt-zinc-cadmium efflux system protein|nr:MAG: cation-efflux pump [Candidatus Saccharibacteria bacterium HGW-Saccharibacteria-1]